MSEAALQRALDLHRSGELEPAWQLYEELLRRNPAHADAWHLSGLIAAQRGDPAEGRRRIEQAIRLDPGRAGFFVNLARLLQQLNLADQAIAAYDRALVLDPRQAEVLAELARLLVARGALEPAIQLGQRALALQPERRDLGLELAANLLAAQRFDAALAALQEILRRNPDDADVIAATGQVMIRQQRFEEAIARYQAALALRSDCTLAEDGLIAVYTRLARTDQALAVIDRKLARRPDDSGARSQRLFLLNYRADLEATEVAAAHREWGRRLLAQLAAPTPQKQLCRPAGKPPRKLRIAYVSADFKRHSVAYFIEPVLAGHDRSAYEVFCYSSTHGADDVSQRLAGLADAWRNVVDWNDTAVFELIVNDRIDILVDLSGHTADHRLGVFARRAAPVQITWLGYPHSTGLPTMDFRICDAISDPPGSADALASERLLRLPGGFLCYRPPDAAAGDDAGFVPPSARGRPFTFGSFNHVAKLSREVIACWARLLRELPEAQLLLKAHGIGAPSTAARLQATFAEAGIAPQRLRLAGATADHGAHLAAYRQIDIALDPFPYNGTTTTFDALWMGVPVIALAGDRHAARVGASLLSTIGHPELVARDSDHYLAIAQALASDPARLAQLHRQLRSELKASPLMDEAGFVRRLEAAYREAWEKTCGPADGVGEPVQKNPDNATSGDSPPAA